MALFTGLPSVQAARLESPRSLARPVGLEASQGKSLWLNSSAPATLLHAHSVTPPATSRWL